MLSSHVLFLRPFCTLGASLRELAWVFSLFGRPALSILLYLLRTRVTAGRIFRM